MGRSEYNGQVISHDPEALPTTLAASRAVVSGAGFGALQDGGYIAAATALVGAVTTTSFTVNAYSYGLLAIGAIELAFEAPDAQVRRQGSLFNAALGMDDIIERGSMDIR